jgi:hypothetical protein
MRRSSRLATLHRVRLIRRKTGARTESDPGQGQLASDPFAAERRVSHRDLDPIGPSEGYPERLRRAPRTTVLQGRPPIDDRVRPSGFARTARPRPTPAADPGGVDPDTDRLDDPGAVAVRPDAGKGHRVVQPAAALLGVAWVDPGQEQPDPHLARPGLGQLADLHHLGCVALLEVPGCAHPAILSAPTQRRTNARGTRSADRALRGGTEVHLGVVGSWRNANMQVKARNEAASCLACTRIAAKLHTPPRLICCRAPRCRAG